MKFFKHEHISHMVVSLLIGNSLSNLTVGVVEGFLSHFPSLQEPITKSMVEFVLSIVLAYLIWKSSRTKH